MRIDTAPHFLYSGFVECAAIETEMLTCHRPFVAPHILGIKIPESTVHSTV
jgi:hypothetical protein